MSIKHTVTLPDGTTVTRTSQNRSYGFAVAISPQPKAELAASLRAHADTQREYLAEQEEIVNYLAANGATEVHGDGHWATLYAVMLKPNKSRSGNEDRLGMRRVGLSSLSPADALEYHQRYVDEYRESIPALEASALEVEAGPDFIGGWHISGWQSRPDLAANEQRRMAAAWPLRRVIVLDAKQN